MRISQLRIIFLYILGLFFVRFLLQGLEILIIEPIIEQFIPDDADVRYYTGSELPPATDAEILSKYVTVFLFLIISILAAKRYIKMKPIYEKEYRERKVEQEEFQAQREKYRQSIREFIDAD